MSIHHLTTTSLIALSLSLSGVPGPLRAQSVQACVPGIGFPCSYEGTVFTSPDELAAAGILTVEQAQLYSMSEAADAAPAQDEAIVESAPSEPAAEADPVPVVTEETGPDPAPEAPADPAAAQAVPTPVDPAPQVATPEPATGETTAEAAPVDPVSPDMPLSDSPATVVEETSTDPAPEAPADPAAAQVVPAPVDPAPQIATPEPAPDAVPAGTASPDVTAIAEETAAETSTPPPADLQALQESATSEVTEEQVTDEDVRSSAQDFETAVGAAPAPQVQYDTDSGGLSTLEKALLLGLGAAVVGTILKNGDEVVSNSGDRVVVRRGDDLRVLKNDNTLMRRPGSDVRTENFSDGSTRTTVTRADGTQIVTVAAPDGRVLRRVRVLPDGQRIVLVDDTANVRPVDLAQLRRARQDQIVAGDVDRLRAALAAQNDVSVGRTFSLDQIRSIKPVRDQVAPIEVSNITFRSGSAAIEPSQAEELSALGRALSDLIGAQPQSVFLVEGHTDAVGDAGYNLALSDRRAETVALALTEYFDVPPENLIVQGYGESDLKVPTLDAERANRRALVRNITPLLR